MLRLNVGCGETHLEGFVNIDVEPDINIGDAKKPDLVLDITKQKLPYRDKEVEEIYCIHNIEHIAYKDWPLVFSEFHRVLRDNGRLFLAYPEFETCAKYYVENHRGMKDFWRACLYGRQLWPGDFHITPVETPSLINLLGRLGFFGFKYASEASPDEMYTNLVCFSGSVVDKESVLKHDLFLDYDVKNGRFATVQP